MRGTIQQLLSAGIHEEDIPHNFVPAVLAAHEKWMVTTKEGLEYAAKIFNFNLRSAEDNKEYTLIDNSTRQTYTLKTSQVHFFDGALVDGVPVRIFDAHQKNNIPPLELEISDLTKTQCDCCGIVSYCIKEVLEPASDKLLNLCNYCITFHEHPRVNELGGMDRCKECSVSNCTHHPGALNKIFG